MTCVLCAARMRPYRPGWSACYDCAVFAGTADGAAAGEIGPAVRAASGTEGSDTGADGTDAPAAAVRAGAVLLAAPVGG